MRSHLRVHYTLKHLAIATVSQWFDRYTYTVRHGLLRGMKRRGGLGFLPERLIGHQETEETRFLAALDLSGAVVYDIGGFQGLLTLFFATRATTVIVYEPNPASRARLVENVRLNHLTNVTVRPVGVGARASESTLVYDPLMPGAASADAEAGGQIRDTSDAARTERIQIVSLDEDRQDRQLPDPSFVKIDVEGMELDVLRGMAETIRRVRPALYIELHGATREQKRRNAREVVTFLSQANYSSILHVETNTLVTPESAEDSPPSHLYCAGDGTVRVSRTT
jgi:FkbM family methyltransferase